jgi:hypothetical protein
MTKLTFLFLFQEWLAIRMNMILEQENRMTEVRLIPFYAKRLLTFEATPKYGNICAAIRIESE